MTPARCFFVLGLTVLLFSVCENPYVQELLRGLATLEGIHVTANSETTFYELKPAFSADLTGYAARVPFLAESVTITGISHKNTKITYQKGDGMVFGPESASGTFFFPPEEMSAEVRIRVEQAYMDSQVYTLSIRRGANTPLWDLHIRTGIDSVDETADTLAYSPDFNGAISAEGGGIFDYAVLVPSTITKILVKDDRKPGVEVVYAQENGSPRDTGLFDFPLTSDMTRIKLTVTDNTVSPPVGPLVYTVTAKRPGKVSIDSSEQGNITFKTDFPPGTMPRFRYGSPVVFEVQPPFGQEIVSVTYKYTPAGGGSPVSENPALLAGQYLFFMPDTGEVTLKGCYGNIEPDLAIAGKVKYVRSGGAGDGSGDIWANASGDLQAIIDGLDPTAEEIWIAEGTLSTPTGFSLQDGVKIYGGFKGTEKNWAGRDNRDWKENETILSGGNAAPHVVIITSGAGTDRTRLEGLCVTGGNSLGQNNVRGAGIHITDASPVLRNLTIRNNIASERGGGLYFKTTDGTHRPVLINVHIRNNTASYDGGGIYTEGGGFGKEARLLMLGGSVTGSQGNGSAIGDGNAASTLINVHISGNRSRGLETVSETKSRLINVTIEGNTGGIAGGNTTQDIIFNSVVWDNGSSNVSGTFTGADNEIQNTKGLPSVLVDNGDDTHYPVDESGNLRSSSPAYFILTDAASGDLLNEIRLFLTTDGAGNPRFNGTSIDIGAFEEP
jgi:hypothetical protein